MADQESQVKAHQNQNVRLGYIDERGNHYHSDGRPFSGADYARWACNGRKKA